MISLTVRAAFWAGTVLAVSVGSTAVSLFGAPSESAAIQLRREGVRAMVNREPSLLAASGFNVAIPWERPLEGATKTTPPDSPVIVTDGDFAGAVVERLRTWASKCREHDIIMMYMMYVAAEPSVRILTGLDPSDSHLLNYIGYSGRDSLNSGVKKLWPAHQYRHVVDWHGNMARWAPCPLETRVWKGLIQPQLELVARTLKETGARGGAALELETYCFYSIYPGMASQKKTFCYCDRCFYGFVERTQQDSPAVLPQVRFDWLTQRGLRALYERYLESELASILSDVMREVRKIDADFLFGLYPYAPFWYYDGLVRGGGTSDLPCLLFPSAEYYSGYTAWLDPKRTFFGDASSAASMAHLRSRALPALYAGGIWSFSTPALALSTDRLVRDAHGYWMYTGRWSTELHDAIGKLHPKVVSWTNSHRGPLQPAELQVEAFPEARSWVEQHRPAGLMVQKEGIVARYQGDSQEVPLSAAGFEAKEKVENGWSGRGDLPSVDDSIVHSGIGSLRWEPSTPRSTPTSPYLDQKVTGAQANQLYELSFWTKTDAAHEATRLWVGRADSDQYPSYMHYTNFALQPNDNWVRLRTAVSFGGADPLVVRFWCPPTDAKLWLDDVRLRPVDKREIDIRLTPPPSAAGWGRVRWTLDPSDARCGGRIIAPESGEDLLISVYSGDHIGALEALVGLQPVTLRLEVYPSAAEPITLQRVEAQFVARSPR